jgi:drug/metabolite transporter (DMT)-like permease
MRWLGASLAGCQQLLFAAETAMVHRLGSSLTAMQIALLRGLGGLLLVAVLARGFRWTLFRTEHLWLQLLRGFVGVAYLWVFAYSFSTLPLTDATALSYSQAIYATLFASLILGERIHAWRWSATVIGIFGAMMIVKPGFQSLSGPYLFVLLGTSMNGLGLVLTKHLEHRDSSLTVMFYVNVVVVACFSAGFTDGISSAQVSPWLLGLVLLGPIGQYLGILAVRYADVSALAPYSYVRLVIATAAALLIFGEVPDTLTIVGATIVLASCVLGAHPSLSFSVRRPFVG